jgi:tetratricopeptide (TPR) repeat protein
MRIASDSALSTSRMMMMMMMMMMMAAAMIVAGCETTPKTSGSAAGPAAAGDAMTAYQARQYDRAYTLASAQAGRTSGAARDQANFISGMSAYQLGREAPTLSHLGPLTSHRDAKIAGPANATLGLINVRRAQYDRAIGYFQSAIKKLHGEDLAQAYFHLGSTEQKLGRWAAARSHMSLAISNSKDATFREAVRQRMNAEAFTLQFGAYSTQANAADRARALSSELRSAGLSAPVIVSTSAKGRTLYLVQSGEYGSYDAALSARRRLSRTDVIITRRGD